MLLSAIDLILIVYVEYVNIIVKNCPMIVFFPI